MNNRKDLEKFALKHKNLTKYLLSNPEIPVEWVKDLQIGDGPNLHKVFVWNGKSNYGFTIFPISIYNEIWTNPINKLTFASCNYSNFIRDFAFPEFNFIYNKKTKKDLKLNYGNSLESVVSDIKKTRKKLQSREGTISYKELYNYQIFINNCTKKETAEYNKGQQKFVDKKTKSETNKILEFIFESEQEK